MGKVSTGKGPGIATLESWQVGAEHPSWPVTVL
jgi:hypothetical protein